MSHTALGLGDIHTLKYLITHVFCPLQLPQDNDHSIQRDHSLVSAISASANLYSNYAGEAVICQWHIISRMLENLQSVILSKNLNEARTISQFNSMDPGDVLAFPIQAKNAGIIFRKQESVTIFEAFKMSPNARDLMSTEGKLLCSYPGPAIEIPNIMLDDQNFLSELVNFLLRMHNDRTHTSDIAQLLTGILRAVGRPADVARISKRVGDDALCERRWSTEWRRSPLWLLIRVVLQTTLARSTLGHHTYKEFMLFFMCCLAEQKIIEDLPSDLICFMSTKIGRRLQKLGPSAPEWLSRTVLETCTSLRSITENRWKEVQANQQTFAPWTPSQLDLARDVHLSLSSSGDYLHNVLTNYSATPPEIPFNPKHSPRGTLDDFFSITGNPFEEGYQAEPLVVLYDVEWAVQQGIDTWVSQAINNDEACMELGILMEKYSSSALKAYADHPELLSVMLLTMIELWVALDQITIKEVPILADYSPEVPISLLEDLLICREASRHRLRRAYRYISRRHSLARNQWSVFSTTITADSFAVRFYSQSGRLKGLKKRIEGDASHECSKKVAELWEMNARYFKLRRQIAETGQSEPDNDIDMRIYAYEWPLPANQFQAEAVVFELDCPVSFNMWRTATYRLLVDVCSPPIEQSEGPRIPLFDFTSLQPYLVKYPWSRISLGSDSRTSILLHSSVRIPAEREQVCVSNPLKFFGFDLRIGARLSDALGRVDSREHCIHKLPRGPYFALQRYVDSTCHTSNEVIANQADCHEDLSVHEYMAFGHLRSGSLLQWLNILRELRGRSLSFRRPEVHMLIAQAVSQAGPLGSSGWTWHQEIFQPTFCSAILGELRSLLHDIEGNWMEGVTMDTISLLLRRLLVAGPNHAVSVEVIALLRAVRGRLFTWIQELLAELVRTPGDERLRGGLRDTAAICRSTFDVGPTMISGALHSAEDIEILLSSAMIIQDLVPSNVHRLSLYSQLLLARDHRSSLSLEDALHNILEADSNNQGIDLAIRRIWPDYHPGSKWISLPAPNSRWFSRTTVPPGGQNPQLLHFNILDGSLLVDGKPLGTGLPKEFVRHASYKLLFGERMLEVLPADLPGMEYSTRGLFANHQVHFSLRNGGSDLVIRAKRKAVGTGDAETLQLVPHEKLVGDLPSVLIEGHAHWLNLATSVIEIRPLDAAWEVSSENWRIDCTLGHYRMWRGHEQLIDLRSQSWDMVSKLLGPISSPQDLIASASPVDADLPTSSLQLSVFLPRYDLTFFVDGDGDLQSHNIRGMVYDENQSVGALFGLVNQLVLRPKLKDVDVVEIIPRCLLIPDGEVSFQMTGHHVRVEINANCPLPRRVAYQTYRVDTDLGYLTGNGSLTSKLYCAYLHALTSGCCADPLTGRPGTEEALSILQSASCWSNTSLSSRDAELWKLIASLSPSRTWTSKDTVQKVEWRNIPVNSQNHEFYTLAKATKDRYKRAELFYESRASPLFEKFPSQDDHLLNRAARRAAQLYPSQFFVRSSSEDVDILYPAREGKVDWGEHRAFTAATYVYHRTATSTKDMWGLVEPWKDMSGNAVLSLQFDKSWLDPDLQSTWITVYNLLRHGDEKKWFRLLFSLPAMAYKSSYFSELAPVFVAFASNPQFRLEDPPPYDSYPISVGCQPSLATLRNHTIDCAHSFERSPEGLELTKYGDISDALKQRQIEKYDSRRNRDAKAIADRLLESWPCETPPPCSLNPHLYNVKELDSRVQRHFSDCFRNLKLKEHLTRVQEILNRSHSEVPSIPKFPQYSFDRAKETPSAPWSLGINHLFNRPAPSLKAHNQLPLFAAADVGSTSLSSSSPLHQLITRVQVDAKNTFHRRYAFDLQTSAEYFGRETTTSSDVTEQPTVETLLDHYIHCRADYADALQHLQQYFGPISQSEQVLERSGQWPRITPHTLARCLASNSPFKLSSEWKRCLISFVLLALGLQRARRLLLLRIDGLDEEFWQELQNEGCDGWTAKSYPDWLLIQLQGNFLIRRVQVEVANEMILPRSKENTVMQLNMGEGKTSVIVPIAAAALAGGDQLVRVIVPKPLVAQSLHVLADRLGGLTNRRIYYLPFSRSLRLDHEIVASLHQIASECMKEHGVLVLQPEHVLSLKLVSVERQLVQAEDGQLANLLLQLQKWFDSHSRDILDESDEILDVRSQLIFTFGLQQHMEGSPERWTTTQQVLNRVSKRALSLRELFPLGVEYGPGPPGSFPYLRILQADAGAKLVSWIAQDILDCRLSNIIFGPLYLHDLDLMNKVRSFISCEDVPEEDAELVKKKFKNTPLWAGLLQLRGLLANGILLFAFGERRWRVDYGLAPIRTTLAVPYRAKDVPAQRAEFGHPDVTIILTCLSYYYGGLSEDHLKRCFHLLLKQQDPSLDYNLWVQGCSAVPEVLRTFSMVNVESEEQWNKFLYPLFSRNLATADFFLSRIVFPGEAKEFPSKLSSSGWDLVEKKERLVTGFSGTNDGQHLLPLHIRQHDPDHQRGTNAKVLAYLLRPENEHYMCTAHENGERRTAREFLEVLVAQQPEIRVLLDVGAQMLDLRNHELAKAWLNINTNVSAAIYFSEADELMVCTRDGSTQLLRASPFVQQLDRCVVYLDDAHTRGTDIRFPSRLRAAVTLGPKVTKDRLVQGCMRMRKLGHGHSVMFFAPLEVDQSIRSVVGKGSPDVINTTDILHWAIRETWKNIQWWAPHWVQQGMDHKSRYAAWSRFCEGHVTPKELLDEWIQPEAKRLEELYEPHKPSNTALLNYPDLGQRRTDLGVQSLLSVDLDEEQEREVIHEIGHERQVQRPPRAEPANHSIDPYVVNFIKTGVLSAWTIFSRKEIKAFKLAFETLDLTSAATNEAYVWSQSILATDDFGKTVEISGKMDDYLRPVNWVVSAKRGSNHVLVLLSPYEVNHLLPEIRSGKKVHLHLYTPHIIKSAKPCDDLSLYSVPAIQGKWIPFSAFRDQLNVFAGQQYLEDYETYIRLCRFLGIYATDLRNEIDVVVEHDGFILPENRHLQYSGTWLAHTFQNSPVVTLRALMDLRSKGVDFSLTHTGKLLRGQLLSEADFGDSGNETLPSCDNTSHAHVLPNAVSLTLFYFFLFPAIYYTHDNPPSRLSDLALH